MADTKISALTPVTTLDDADDLVLARSGSSNRITGQQMPGFELDYVQITSNVAVSATTEGAANTVVTASAVTFDGTPVIIEFFSPSVLNGTNGFTALVLFEDSSPIGVLGFAGDGAGTWSGPVLLRRRMTPSAASHTYSIRAYRVTANSTIVANTGGAATNMPSYIRITRA